MRAKQILSTSSEVKCILVSMPNSAKGETQNVRLTDIKVQVVRIAKSKAALEGKSLSAYLADLVTKVLEQDAA